MSLKSDIFIDTVTSEIKETCKRYGITAFQFHAKFDDKSSLNHTNANAEIASLFSVHSLMHSLARLAQGLKEHEAE